jgi:hypothetical protein
MKFTPRTFYFQGKSPWYPLDRRLDGPQIRSGRAGEEKNSQPLRGIEPPIIQPVAHRYTAELSRLLPHMEMVRRNKAARKTRDRNKVDDERERNRGKEIMKGRENKREERQKERINERKIKEKGSKTERKTQKEKNKIKEEVVEEERKK